MPGVSHPCFEGEMRRDQGSIAIFTFMPAKCCLKILPIREIPDHATFREKVHLLSWLEKLGGFLSLALCNQANFDQVWLSKLKDFLQFLICRKFYGTMASPGNKS